MVVKLITLLLLIGATIAQLPGTGLNDQPTLYLEECVAGICIQNTSSLSMDANFRLVTNAGGSYCFLNGRWVPHICSNPVQCAQACQISGVSSFAYLSYGVRIDGRWISFQLKNKPNTQDSNSLAIGGRVFVLEKDKPLYKKFNMLNREFSIDISYPNIPAILNCGTIGQIKFVEMPADGGMAENPLNKAGPFFGTGYCDGSCTRENTFVNGEANMLDWQYYSATGSGRGRYGSCCNEFSVWEGNIEANAMTARLCNSPGNKRCNSTAGECNQQCDRDGCDFNPFRMGNKTLYGPNASIDSTVQFTVVTQFITHDGTDNGDLVEIRRIYKQGDKIIYNSVARDPSFNGADSITDNYCDKQKTLFGETNNFKVKGGMKALGESFKRGMVMSIGFGLDNERNASWLDSIYPENADPSSPGVLRGTCSKTSGIPSNVLNDNLEYAVVRFTSFKFGKIGQTSPTQAPTVAPPTLPPTLSPTVPPTLPPTQTPTLPPTVPPTQPPTETPTQTPTQSPTHSPINNCGAAFSFSQTRSLAWESTGVTYSRWAVVLTSSLPIHSISLSLSSFTEVQKLTHLGGDAYTFADLRLFQGDVIPANIPISFSYSKKGADSSSVTVLSANCSAGVEGDGVNNDTNNSSSLSSSFFSVIAFAVVALVSYLL